MKQLSCWMSAALMVFAAGCGDHDHGPGGHSHAAPPTGAAAPAGAKSDGHGAHGPSIVLGETKVAHIAVKASRDEGAIVPGGEAPVDVWLGFDAADPQPVAVRFWIGSADGKGAMKAKAGPEKAGDKNNFHAHAEVPKDLAADAKLHVEVEDAAGKTHLASFDLKR